MSSTWFEPEGSSSGRQLYIQLWYGKFYKHQSSRHQHTLLPIRLFVHTDACKAYRTVTVYTSAVQKMNLSFETCRIHQNLKKKLKYNFGKCAFRWFM